MIHLARFGWRWQMGILTYPAGVLAAEAGIPNHGFRVVDFGPGLSHRRNLICLKSAKPLHVTIILECGGAGDNRLRYFRIRALP
jgi:hypothetical protein